MHFTWLDWAIVATVFAGLTVAVAYANRHTKSVADYLAAGRGAGRYMMVMASGMVWIGAINVVAMFEMYDAAGFGPLWWVMLTTPVILYLNITGFGVYRFRETRAMTVAQFLETRYNRGVRVYAGILAWTTGLLYFGIFPAVGARFFIAFCGLPEQFSWLGYDWTSFPLVMLALLSASLMFVFVGGHIAVIVTDCLQGIFTQVAAIAIVIVMAYLWLDWGQVVDVLKSSAVSQDASLLDPIHAQRAAGGFDFWFFLISMVVAWYSVMSNMQGQAYVASSKTAHEFRMGAALNQWRWLALLLLFMVLVLAAKVAMHHPQHTDVAADIEADLNQVSADPQDALRKQVTITTALAHIMPVGLSGVFAAIMLAALISTYDSFMHTWGSVFLQDVVMPFRRRPFGNRLHLLLLRLSILGVAVVAYLISWRLFDFQDSLLMYFAAINNIWLGGAGAVILGGLYWRRGTSAAALVTLVLGTVVGIAGFACTQFWPYSEPFPVNPQWFFMWSVLACSAVYVLVSLIGNTDFNMDQLLHRGRYAVETDQTNIHERISWAHRLFGIDREFNRTDRWIAFAIVGWFLAWLGVFLVGTACGIVFDPGEDAWARFWRVYLWMLFVLALVVTVWFSVGGFRDILRLFQQLRTQERDYADDGTVRKDNP